MDSRKSMRHFYCKDVLWDTFESMAADFAVSVDYLINESMRHYAKNKGYQVGERTTSQPDGSTAPVTVEMSQLMTPRKLPPLPTPTTSDTARSKRPSGNFSLGPDLFTDPGDEPAILTLYIVFENEKIPVTKDQFIIGRVSKLCDLTLKDANVSRKHAAIIRKNNNYYIKDLGSTNGIEYNGMRIDNKRIDEGDTFSICEHAFSFTFK